VKKLLSAVAAVSCCIWAAEPASAQYNGYVAQGRPTGPAMAPAGYGMPSFQSSRPQSAVRPAAAVAMRPTTTSYAAQPASYQFKPVNPPSQSTQRLLLASRNTPTPAPPVNGGAASRTASAPPQQYWNASSTNAQPWDPSAAAPAYGGGGSSYGGGASYGPQAGGPVADGGGGGGCGTDGGTCGGDDGCNTGGGGCCLAGKRCCLCIRSTGDMVQHMPFFGTTHGYYYFRPYHVMHVFSQQELATRWGGDARNPCDNCLFQKVYEQMGVAATLPPVSVAAPPSTPDYVVPNGTQVVPTPMPAGPAQQYGPVPQYNAAPQYNTMPQYNGAPQYGPGPQYNGAPQYMPAPQYVPGQNVVPAPGAPGAQPNVEYLPPR